MQCILKIFCKKCNLYFKLNNLSEIWIISETDVLHLAGGLREHFSPNIFFSGTNWTFFPNFSLLWALRMVTLSKKEQKVVNVIDGRTQWQFFLGWLLLLVHCWLNWSNQIGWCVFSFVTNSELFCLPFEEPDTIILIKENSKKNWSQLRLER